MRRNFMAFWRKTTVDSYLRTGQCLHYAASNQYRRVASGDTVWIITVRAGRLHLVGRIVVALVMDPFGIARVLPGQEVWSANCYILPVPETICRAVDIDIHHLVPMLRFESANDRLVPNVEGLVSGGSFQSVRRLTDESAQRLSDTLHSVTIERAEEIVGGHYS